LDIYDRLGRFGADGDLVGRLGQETPARNSGGVDCGEEGGGVADLVECGVVTLDGLAEQHFLGRIKSLAENQGHHAEGHLRNRDVVALGALAVLADLGGGTEAEASLA
jgi:hypothetical protein